MNNYFNNALTFVGKWEWSNRADGGYTNDPIDPGGETKYGISKRCLDSSTQVLTSSLDWKSLNDCIEGEEILAFSDGKASERKFEITTINKIGRTILPTFRVVTNRGTVVCSDDHLWIHKYKKGNSVSSSWRKTKDLKVGDKLSFCLEPWSTLDSRDAGYLSGILDGEGHTDGSSIYFCQKDVGDNSIVIKETLTTAERLGFPFYLSRERISGNIYRFNQRDSFEGIKLLSSIQSKRLLEKYKRKLIGKTTHSKLSVDAVIESISFLGETELVTLETGTETLIANGFLTHNSYPDIDIKSLTLAEASLLYKKDYWDKIDCDSMEKALAIVCFDSAVNCGVGRVKSWLAELNEKEKAGELRGSKERWMIQRRIQYYKILVEKKPALNKYIKGWLNRVNDLSKYVDIVSA